MREKQRVPREGQSIGNDNVVLTKYSDRTLALTDRKSGILLGWTPKPVKAERLTEVWDAFFDWFYERNTAVNVLNFLAYQGIILHYDLTKLDELKGKKFQIGD